MTPMKCCLFASTVSVFMLTLASVTAAGSPGSLATAAGELPAGPGKDTLVRVCSDCHGVDLIDGQRRTRAAWNELVQDMVARGANASDDDTKAIINYLATSLGRVNVNKADATDLEAVLGLSATEAAAIVSARSTAEFKTLEDLKRVPGLDFAKVEATKDRITFAGQ